VSVNNGAACVDLVGAKGSQSEVESGKVGPGIDASSRKEIPFPNFRGAAAQAQESTQVG